MLRLAALTALLAPLLLQGQLQGEAPGRTPPGAEEARALGNEGVIGGESDPKLREALEGKKAGEEAEAAPKSVKATATVWAQANSRSWLTCSNTANEGGQQLWSFSERANTFREGHHWEYQVRDCPNTPEVLTMAVRVELMRRFDLPEGLDETTDLSALAADTEASKRRALEWIDRAEAELRRRRDHRAFGLEYWRGRALLQLRDFDGADAAFERALAEGAIEGWKLRRLFALAALYAGDLDRALAFASRALLDAPGNDRVASLYVMGLVLDRAGDPSGAKRYMISALNADGDRSTHRGLETAMPLHERLYFRAFAKTVKLEQSGALRLWKAYLARSEPEAPERRLAERHFESLEPRPTSLGGPARPGEAPGS